MNGFSKKVDWDGKLYLIEAAKPLILKIYLFSAQNVEQFENIP
jgi:hypothetical protein